MLGRRLAEGLLQRRRVAGLGDGRELLLERRARLLVLGQDVRGAHALLGAAAGATRHELEHEQRDHHKVPRRDHAAYDRRLHELLGRREAQARVEGARLDADQLDVEDEHRVRRDLAARAARAVRQLARDVQRPSLAGAHQLQGLRPARDHLAGRKDGGLAALAARVEDGAVEKLALVMHRALLRRRRRGRRGVNRRGLHLVLEPGRQRDDALRVLVVGEEGEALRARGGHEEARR